jgi:hypothetical protein
MYERWEVADIAVFILLRTRGHLISRKVALLQTKRLYSQEIAGTELDRADYMIDIAAASGLPKHSVRCQIRYARCGGLL